MTVNREDPISINEVHCPIGYMNLRLELRRNDPWHEVSTLPNFRRTSFLTIETKAPLSTRATKFCLSTIKKSLFEGVGPSNDGELWRYSVAASLPGASEISLPGILGYHLILCVREGSGAVSVNRWWGTGGSTRRRNVTAVSQRIIVMDRIVVVLIIKLRRILLKTKVFNMMIAVTIHMSKYSIAEANRTSAPGPPGVSAFSARRKKLPLSGVLNRRWSTIYDRERGRSE